MNELATFCVIGAFGLLALAVMFMFMRGMGGTGYGPNYSERGDEYPHYDDPNIRSRGGFGRNRGLFQRRTPSQTGGSTGGRVDSPDIGSRGSFGRSKD